MTTSNNTNKNNNNCHRYRYHHLNITIMKHTWTATSPTPPNDSTDDDDVSQQTRTSLTCLRGDGEDVHVDHGQHQDWQQDRQCQQRRPPPEGDLVMKVGRTEDFFPPSPRVPQLPLSVHDEGVQVDGGGDRLQIRAVDVVCSPTEQGPSAGLESGGGGAVVE